MNNRCHSCNAKILPDDMVYLQTISGNRVLIYAKDFYILEVVCHFCRYHNFIKKPGLTKEDMASILESKLSTEE